MLKSAKHKCSNAVSSHYFLASQNSAYSLAAHHIQQTADLRDKMKAEVNALQEEKEHLQEKIAQYQASLPVDGIPAVPAAKRSREALYALFHSYVADRTRKNWRFYPYSLVLKRIFDAFQSTVSCDSSDEFLRSLNEWKSNSINLGQLRQIASQAVMEMGQTTSLITCKNRPRRRNDR